MGSSVRAWFFLSFAAGFGADAFTIQTVASHGCHEQISRVALAQATALSARLERSPRLPANLVSELPFDFKENEPAFLGAVLVGVRHNDLHGFEPLDFPELVNTQEAAPFQREHCLRQPGETGTAGDTAALKDCHDFILEELALALGEGARMDLVVTTPVEVALAFERRPVALTASGFHLGRALHALQDSFSHTYRDGEVVKVTSVLTYLGTSERSYVEAIDGSPHRGDFDHCQDQTPRTTMRTERAVAASAALLVALEDGVDRSPGEHLARARSVLSNLLSLASGCTHSNGYCESVSQDAVTRVGCGMDPGAGLAGTAVVLVAVGWVLRRRRAGGLLVVLLFAGTARAEGPWSLVGGVGVAIDRGGAQVDVGFERVVGRALLGGRLEWSPWFDVLTYRSAPGTLNAYGTAAWVWHGDASLQVRSGASLGLSGSTVSYSAFPGGSVGPYLAASFLSAAFRLGPATWLEFSPELAASVPDLRAVPFVYRQYRLRLSLEWGL